MIERIDIQKLLEKYQESLNAQVQVTNRDGIIIATLDENLKGKINETSVLCMAENQSLTIDEQQCNNGIYLPLEYSDQVIGCIHIISHGQSMVHQANIIKATLEYMVTDKMDDDHDDLHQESIKMFFAQLLMSDVTYDDQLFHKKANQLKINYRDKYIIIGKVIDPKHEYWKLLEEHRDEIRVYLRRQLGYCFCTYKNQFLIIGSASGSLEDKLERIQSRLQSIFKIEFRFVYSRICRCLKDYPKQFKLLRNISESAFIVNSKESIHSVFNREERYIVEKMDEEHIKEYLLFFDELHDDFMMDKNRVLMETVKAYFESGMNIKKTSEDLYVHRNTVTYRLNGFEKIYGFDITEPIVCMKVYFSILCMEKLEFVSKLH